MALLQLPLFVGMSWLALAEATESGNGVVTSAIKSFQNTLRGVSSEAQETYTLNSACLPNYCINPVIPGLMFLGENVLEKNRQEKWLCAGISNTKSLFKLGGFCSRIIAAYPFSVPQPKDTNSTEASEIQKQSYKALETFVGHLSGMGFDFWDHTEPWNGENECIQSVWKMACYTHFPRCNEISDGEYLPPCKSSCEGYLKKCKVQCCDEGTQCTFTHAKVIDGKTVYEKGYPNHVGPSPLCTGGTKRPIAAVATLFLAFLMAAQY